MILRVGADSAVIGVQQQQRQCASQATKSRAPCTKSCVRPCCNYLSLGYHTALYGCEAFIHGNRIR